MLSLCLHQEQPAAKQPAAASVSPASENQEMKAAAPSKAEEQEPEGIPVEELEAKMLSVQKALERFDAVKVWPLSARYKLDLPCFRSM